MIARISQSVRPVIQVMFDVDNWLREHPLDSNPTARICGRYISLLRHILAVTPAYRKIIIVAHSQGTVITSDFLRYITTEQRNAPMDSYDSELKNLGKDPRIFLFTMGCPLRQLYAARFPYLYGYARGPRAPIPPGEYPDIQKHDLPDHRKLGVALWWNVYRSGDYVGRYLWRSENCECLFDTITTTSTEVWDLPVIPKSVSFDEKQTRLEFCIGPGAHTHYWDGSAEIVAELLDRLIML